MLPLGLNLKTDEVFFCILGMGSHGFLMEINW